MRYSIVAAALAASALWISGVYERELWRVPVVGLLIVAIYAMGVLRAGFSH